MRTLDMMNKACPAPVIEAKKLLESEDHLRILVDNDVATRNLSKLANSLNATSEIEEVSDEEFIVTISKDGNIPVVEDNSSGAIPTSDSYSVVISKNLMGGGDDRLGKALMKSFTYALSEQDLAPEKIIFFNAGVKVACEGSDCLEDLKKLVEAGSELIVCGACLDFYELKEKLALGEISNMYSIVEYMRKSNRIVQP